MPQGRLSGRFRQRGAVLDGGMRMPALPVAQMAGAGQADQACKTDVRLVLSRVKGSAFQQRVEDGARKVG